MTATYTPMMEQYREIKGRHPQEILFFRLGDFYEMFFADAEIASRELEITLTARDGGGGMRVPMCGVPYHAAENYILRLINKGFRVAICEQVEDPKQVKGIVRREVVKIITPGTILSEAALIDKSNNYLVTLYGENETLGLCAADITTGECTWATFTGTDRITTLCDYLFRLSPAELVWVNTVPLQKQIESFLENRIPNCARTTMDLADIQDVEELPKQHFDSVEVPTCRTAYLAVSCLLHYLHEAIKCDISHINHLVKLDNNDYLILDASSLRNLEISRNIRDGGKKGTLLDVLDFTKTAMGGRLLRKWLEYPLLNAEDIITRQESVAELVEKSILRKSLQQLLANIYDFERIVTRIEIGAANARDLSALKTSLAVLPEIITNLADTHSRTLTQICRYTVLHEDIVVLIDKAIVDNAPLSVRDGGMIKPGYNSELDELRSIASDSKKWIQELEAREKEQSGIKSLKVGFNKVFGYYLEVTHANTSAVPAHYIRKQTLANAERYITPELKDFEIKVLGAQEKIVTIEYHLLNEIREHIKCQIKGIQETARQIASLDALASLSEAAFQYNYVRPTIGTNREIHIKDGRHPIVERLLVREMFVPNDVLLNHYETEIAVITGPNMAGKSTYMRQVALLVLMTQIGSFIPAREAYVSPVDRIFTRVGASDDLATGQSTFMVEMNEVAHILKYATGNSLVILDEIGRGTSTFDGMSIARAVIEYVKERIKAKTLFATHYHELTGMADEYEGIKNYTVAVKERGNEVIFLRRIIPGGADKSYGIHVAQLAGLPKKLIQRSQQILAELESCQTNKEAGFEQLAAATASVNVTQSLFSSAVADELRSIDILSITPIEAMNLLYRLHNQAKEEVGRG
ncbi:MAG: mismatch repair protein mutS [Anaerospora sp.]|nr:mismatch repair protein mutS [Anaerospora sp.]